MVILNYGEFLVMQENTCAVFTELKTKIKITCSFVHSA